MKHRRVLLQIFVMMFLGMFYLGCAEKEEQHESEEVNTAIQVTDDGEQDKTASLIQPGVGVGKVHFGMSSDDLKEALGKPDIDATGNSYVYADLGIEVVIRDEKVRSIYCVHHIDNAPEVQTCKYRTAEGIGIGSTEPDIISAYGEPSKRSKGALMYRELGLRMELDNGQVHRIIALKPG